MSQRARKCHRCQESKKNYSVYRDKVVCDDCFEDYMKLPITCSECGKKTQRKNEFLPDEKTKSTFCSEGCYNHYLQDKADLDELDKWLKEYHGVEKLNSRVYSQVMKYKKEGYSIKNTFLTLRYISEVKKRDLQHDNISLCSWYFDEAREHYIALEKLQRRGKELEASGFKTISGERVVQYKPNDSTERLSRILVTEIDFSTGV